MVLINGLIHRTTNFTCDKFNHLTSQREKKGADQTVQMHSLSCAFVVCMQQRKIFV